MPDPTSPVPEQLYVPTDVRGTQYFGDAEIRWSLPVENEDGTFRPGQLVTASRTQALPLMSLDGLLDEIGERIFVAELEPDAGARLADFGVEADAARLVASTDWSVGECARFALDCARHVLGDRTSMALPSGSTLGSVLDAAERWLDRADAGVAGLLGRMSRLATARRLRRQGRDVSNLAFALGVDDADRDLDVLQDPEWVSVAAARDAVLAAVEAIRHSAFPQVLEDENVRYEIDNENDNQPPEVVETPWGNFMAGRRSGVVPAWVAARDAAERARQAAADVGGAEAEMAERAWQRERLRAGLG